MDNYFVMLTLTFHRLILHVDQRVDDSPYRSMINHQQQSPLKSD